MYDTVIIGAGPAGLSAGIYGKRAGMSLTILEKAYPGGQITLTSEVENYPGLYAVSGFDLAEAFRKQCVELGAEFTEGEAKDFSRVDDHYEIQLKGGEVLETKTILLATGARPKKLDIPGEERLRGVGVSYCATCDGAFFRKKDVVVIGGGNTAVEDAIYLSKLCHSVVLVHRRDALRADRVLTGTLQSIENIDVLWNSVPTEINGEDMVESITVENVTTGEQTELPCSGIFVAIGSEPVNLGLQDRIETDSNGYFVAGESCETNVPGIYAAGDVRTKELRQVVTAAADGANAIHSIEVFLATKKG